MPSMLVRELVPDEPGVYAWYRDGKRMYLGKADSLRHRVYANHLGQSRAPTGSAFRRNVAEYLGFGKPASLKNRVLQLSADQLDAIRSWILSCEIAWLTCPTKAGAIALERKLKLEFKPPLTKR
jgi:excinuclease UvrABC nuclease subunit